MTKLACFSRSTCRGGPTRARHHSPWCVCRRLFPNQRDEWLTLTCRIWAASDASAAAVPWLYFVLDDAVVPARGAALGLVVDCAASSSHMSRPAWRNIKLWVLCSIHSRGLAAANCAAA